MEKVWVVVTDNVRGRIFEAVVPNQRKLHEIETLVNPDRGGLERQIVAVSDTNNQYFGKIQRHQMPATVRGTDSASRTSERFAKAIGTVLHRARMAHRYDELHVFAPPTFFGLLHNSLDSETQQKLDSDQAKDISRLDMSDVERYIAALH